MNTKNSIVIDQGRALPYPFAFLGTVLVIIFATIATNLFSKNLAIFALMCIGSLIPMIWTSRFILEINLEQKFVREYVWVLGRKFGKAESFQNAIRLYFKQVRSSQRVNSSTSGYTNYYEEYAAFLKFEGHETVELTRSKNREKLIHHLDKFSKKLNLPVEEIV